MNHSNRHSPAVRILHWLVAACVIGALAMIELKGFLPKGTALRKGMMWAHLQFGISVLLLYLPRAIVALTSVTPPITPPIPSWQHLAARAVHIALYVLMLAAPLAGMLLAQAEGREFTFLGAQVPDLVMKDRRLAGRLEDWHELAGNLMLYTALLHAAAALFHHYVQRDDTLLRMLRGRR